MSPQLALRVAVLGGVALVMFAIIFFRLWYLQILTGEQYVQQANANRIRELPIAPPRGEILDREGKPLASSVITNAVQIVPSQMPAVITEQVSAYQALLTKAQKRELALEHRLKRLGAELAASPHRATRAQRSELRGLEHRVAHPPNVPVPALSASAAKMRSLFDRLGAVIRLSPRLIDERVIRGMTATPYANVTVKTDAGRAALTVLAERQNEFPGVAQQPVTIRHYPYEDLGAQALGYVGQVSPEELELKAFRGVKQGTIVGKGGVEYYYDGYLRGKPGVTKVEVNAAGEPVPVGEPLPAQLTPVAPKAGYNLKLTLDLGLQKEGEKALVQGMELAHALGHPGDAGGFLAMDPRNGQILAIGSNPTYNPNELVRPLTTPQYEALIGSNSGNGGAPLENRASEGAYPTGSTFKPITAIASLEAGTLNPSEGLGAGRCITVSTEPFCNAGHAEYGAVGLVDALKVSSDTYFFEVGKRDFSHGNVIQNMARELGIGRETGVDLPYDPPGVLPDREWREKRNQLELHCERVTHRSSCGIVGEASHQWSVGDDMHLAVGQGDLVTSPLQMAVAYSTLANAFTHHGEGTVVRPHLGMEVQEPNGGLVQALNFPPRRVVHLNYSNVSLVMEGIHDATSLQGGTSQDVWNGWNQAEHPVYGKTGTAERAGQVEQAWYMCYIPDPKRPIVIAVTIEQGGFGDQAAAPVARLMASQWFGKPEKLVSGSNRSF
ncbi:MAG TPA: penicillin-binding transpeptidase domain-containing protein [Solirubrobacteraceae bacterium]